MNVCERQTVGWRDPETPMNGRSQRVWVSTQPSSREPSRQSQMFLPEALDTPQQSWKLLDLPDEGCLASSHLDSHPRSQHTFKEKNGSFLQISHLLPCGNHAINLFALFPTNCLVPSLLGIFGNSFFLGNTCQRTWATVSDKYYWRSWVWSHH